MAEAQNSVSEISPEQEQGQGQETDKESNFPTNAATEEVDGERETDAPKEETVAEGEVNGRQVSGIDDVEADQVVGDDGADHKRKLVDLESAPDASDNPEVGDVDEEDVEGETKRQKVEDEGPVFVADAEKVGEVISMANGQIAENENQIYCSDHVDEEQIIPGPTQSRKIEVPNNKVGVLIGKAGDTIRYLQINSGAKIQITRDAEADPNSSTRPVELIGTLEEVSRAEQLIKDVIAEADAGGSPALVARGFGAAHAGAEQIEIQVPNDKVGLIIGKGGDTIKSLQTRSCARIQLIPQHLPEGDEPKERTIRISGSKKQIEAAKELINDAMNQKLSRSMVQSGGYSQQGHRSRGPGGMSQWGPHGQPPSQGTMGYGYQQRGMPPHQNMSYPQNYSSYSQPPPQRTASNNWDQRPGPPIQSGGYDYYKQGGHPYETQQSVHSSGAPANYNYGPASGYGPQGQYPQSAPSTYGHGYDGPKYNTQVPGQQYGQPSMGPQGGYPQSQDPYGKPGYAAPQQSYGPPSGQPGDPMYQGSTTTYVSGPPGQQGYQYGSTAPQTQAPNYGPTYGQTPGAADPYAHSAHSGYPPHVGQAASGYGQNAPGGPVYPQQSAQSANYGQYPSQTIYANQNVPAYANYANQPADASYGNSYPSSGYGAAAPAGQAAYGQVPYAQPNANQPNYDQAVAAPQAGYAAQPAAATAAPAPYAKGVSPQPGYTGQWQA